MLRILGCITFLLLLTPAFAQKVGVVLSGGGSSGIAHVGVLKALEANHIPIDYIAGTSMGALVGGMYAMGFTPDEIEKIILSEAFDKMVFGKTDDKYIYYFRERDPNSSWVGLKFRVDSTIHTSLPTSIISPITMDFAFLESTSAVSQAAGYNFDSLLVPYRAVAADIHNKAEVVFRNGEIGQAMRASSTYPFFYKPIVVDDKLLFDGGLYNNFPADVMYQDFLPDVIIGSTVAVEMTPPNEDDILGQIKNMLMERTSYTEVCETQSMLIVRPKIPKVSILDFSQSKAMVLGGFNSTMLRMDEIKAMVYRREDSLTLNNKRLKFKSKFKPLIFKDLAIEGLSKNQSAYIKGVLGSKKYPISSEELRPVYFRLALDDRIKKIYPVARYDSTLQGFRLKLKMKLDKDLFAQFGGVFSSRPINTGFIALRYKRINRIGLTADGNAYFGKFYGSTQVKASFDFPFRLPFILESDFTLNNLNFFNSASTFFEDIKPSYLIQYERAFSVNLAIPMGNKGRLRIGGSGVRMFDDYYQVESFTKADTADRTEFNHGSGWIQFERNSLNRKFYASTGSMLKLTIRYVDGVEVNTPGSTSTKKDVYRQRHDFFRAKLTYESYFNKRGIVRPGLFAQMVVSNQPFFNNYNASLIEAAVFNPVPESQTRFMQVFRTHNYAAGGVRTIFSLHSRLDLRLEGFIFQPHREILSENFLPKYGDKFAKRYFMASAVLVFHTPVAPLALSVNYFDQETEPISVIFTAGFLLFNKRALD
jgi:NTE family protein